MDGPTRTVVLKHGHILESGCSPDRLDETASGISISKVDSDVLPV